MYKGRVVAVHLNALRLVVDPEAMIRMVRLAEAPEDMARLWSAHRDTHFFRRDGEQVIAIPLDTDAPSLDGTFEERRAIDDLRLVAALTTDALLKRFCDRQVIGRQPLRFRAAGRNNDLVLSALGNKTADTLRDLTVRPILTLYATVLSPSKLTDQLVLVVDVSVGYAVESNCATLLGEGFPVLGHYVAQAVQSDDPRLQDQLELLGRVVEVTAEGKLVLDETREPIGPVEPEAVYLEPRQETIQSILRHRLTTEAETAWQRVHKSCLRVVQGPGKRDLLDKVRDALSGEPLAIAPSVTVLVGHPLSDGVSSSSLQRSTLPRPVFEFDPSGAKSSSWAEEGLKKYGPFSARTFSPSTPRIAVLCHINHKGQVEQLIRKLEDGLRINGHGTRQPFDDGFVRRFNLKALRFTFFTVTSDDAAEYRRAALHAVAQAAEADEPWNLAYIQIRDEFRNRPDPENPYLVTKAAFLAHGVPTQEFQIEKAVLPDYQLSFILNSMALASYCKLGGTPWLIHADRGLSHELVVGLGSTTMTSGRLSPGKRYVGITTVFSGDGQYRVSRTSRAVPYEEYPEAVLDSLKSVMKRLSAELNWQPGDTVRLVFHTFKPIRDVEAEAVLSLMQELAQFRVEFASLHLADNHDWHLFDEAQANNPKRERQYVPDRGLHVPLSQERALLTLMGNKDMRSDSFGMPRPLEMTLHRSSTFRDMDYLAKQVMWFSANSWRSYSPAHLPVTILYSEIIAKLLSQMARIPNFDPSILVGKVGRGRWFL